jgi:hypothetical protein
MPIIGILSSGGLAPGAPTIGTATDGGTGTSASVAFTVPSYVGKGSGTVTYTATSSPGSLTGTATSSPVTVSGLTTGTAYTFTVKATTSYSVTGASSSASNSVTPASPSSYESIATVTAAGGETSLNFTSIPGTYKSLQIRGWLKSSGGGGGNMRYNSDTGSNYALHSVGGNGSSVFASGSASQTYMFIVDTSGSTYNSTTIVDIIDYASTTKNKTMSAWYGYDNNSTNGSTYLYSGLWMSTSAITSIQLGTGNFSGTFAAGSTFALYGIKA